MDRGRTMMDDEQRYTAASWFVAGYLAALPDWIDATSMAKTELLSHVERYDEGRCLACHRGGVVILDGYFCERCHPGIDELL